MKTVPKINICRIWNADSVRSLCIKYSLYTHGNGRSYNEMLNFVGKTEPTVENVYLVAKDINEHSNDERPIESIMFLLEKDAVDTLYDIVEDGEE